MAGVEIPKGIYYEDRYMGLEVLYLVKINDKKQAVQSPIYLYARDEKRLVSRLGWGLFALLLIMLAAAFVMTLIMSMAAPDWVDSQYYLLIMNLVAQYCLAFPIGIWLLRRQPKSCIRESRLEFAQGARLFFICWFLMIVGSLLGAGAEALMEQCFGIESVDYIDELLSEIDVFSSFAVAVMLAPIFEEAVFRKLLLDRLIKYGELPAVVASGVLFGLYHCNFSQLFYAVLVGMVLAYVYVKTGRLRYSVILHMLLNLNGAVLAPWLAANEGSVLASVYILLQMAMIIAGAVFLIKSRKLVRFVPSEYNISGREAQSIIWLNPGMMAFLLLIIINFAVNL